MHADEVDTDATLVRRLLIAQFPQWADLPIEPVPDTDAVAAAWDAALEAPVWPCPAVWVHGDLSSGNLLVVRGRLSAFALPYYLSTNPVIVASARHTIAEVLADHEGDA